MERYCSSLSVVGDARASKLTLCVFKIDSIPTIGYDSFIGSYFSSWKYVISGHTMLEEGYKKVGRYLDHLTDRLLEYSLRSIPVERSRLQASKLPLVGISLSTAPS